MHISTLLLVLICQDTAQPAPLNQRAADYVSIRSGRPLFGIVLRETRHEVTVAVRRSWLQTDQPETYEQELAAERETGLHNRERIAERVQAWMAERPDDDDLLDFLREQEQLLRQPAAGVNEPLSEFMVVAIPARHVRRIHRRGGPRRQAALLAWREKLSGVETRSAESLAAGLRDKGIAIDATPVDLSDRFPPRPEGERDWAARQAIIEHLYRRPVELKGTPELLVRENADGQPANVAALMQKMLQSRVGSLLRELTEPGTRPGRNQDAWRRQAMAELRKSDARAVRVTIVQPDSTLSRPTVRSYFLARMPDQSWVVLWHETVEPDPEARPELEDLIRDDPQVAAILRSVGAAAGEDVINQAIRFGAATMEGQRKADESFFAWRHPYFDRLDHPAIRVRK